MRDRVGQRPVFTKMRRSYSVVLGKLTLKVSTREPVHTKT